MLLQTLQRLTVCGGCDFEKYSQYLDMSSGDTVYKTNNGEPAAFVETNLSNFHSKIIRSAKCSVLLPYNDLVSTKKVCDSCCHIEPYLRNIKSINKAKQNVDSDETPKQSKFTRLDKLSYSELLNVARNSSKKLHSLNIKMKRLEEYKEKMENVGKETDDDLKFIFNQLYKGIKKNRKNQENPVCEWKGCNIEERFSDCEALFQHVKSHSETQVDSAPINRKYPCLWESCQKSFTKKKLLENHIRDHTGDVSDQFFEILLKDQAKAMSMPSRQMCWHPLVIKWCLRMYNKSHQSYNDMRNSKVLRLPSGRTLNDYRNFNYPSSGWQMSHIEAMSNHFKTLKLRKKDRLGALLFDEVKIKEGLVFDPSTWELVGFTDLGDNCDLTDSKLSISSEEKSKKTSPKEKLATHILQFFYKSIFGSFSYPCAYFLTRGINAMKLNRIFWQGVSMLHGFEFEVLLVCCDGAPENRKFICINSGYEGSLCKAYNYYSRLPMFFLSDPPHLVKKLRNNLFKSGDREDGNRYTRKLTRNGTQFMLWKHIVSVYDRDKLRHCYVTKIRRGHVFLDSLSKMRVKLAVDVLSSAVSNEMHLNDNIETVETQRYIEECEKLWNIFNSMDPVRSDNDPKLQELLEGLSYFTLWKSDLSRIYRTKKEQAAHFIAWQTYNDLQVSKTVQVCPLTWKF